LGFDRIGCGVQISVDCCDKVPKSRKPRGIGDSCAAEEDHRPGLVVL